MTPEERIAALETRLAQAEARVAALEARPVVVFPLTEPTPWLGSEGSPGRVPCGFCGSLMCGGMHVTCGGNGGVSVVGSSQ